MWGCCVLPETRPGRSTAALSLLRACSQHSTLTLVFNPHSTHTPSIALVRFAFGGAAGSAVDTIAAQCVAANTTESCAAAGAPVELDAGLLAALAAGNATLADGTAVLTGGVVEDAPANTTAAPAKTGGAGAAAPSAAAAAAALLLAALL